MGLGFLEKKQIRFGEVFEGLEWGLYRESMTYGRPAPFLGGPPVDR